MKKVYNKLQIKQKIKHWKRGYTAVVILNFFYILFFYLLMQLYT